MSYKLQLDDFKDLPAKENTQEYKLQLDDFTQPEKSGLEQLGDLAQKYVIDPVESARLPELAGGILQGGLQGAESIANLPLEAISKLINRDVTIPYTNLSQYAKQDPLSKLAFGAGEVGGSIAPAGAVYNKATQALSKFLNPSLLQKSLAGATAGFAGGGGENPIADEYTGSESGDLLNRLLEGAIGGALPVASGLRKSKIAKEVINRKKGLEDKFAKKYSSMFSELEKKGLDDDKLKIPSILKNYENSPALKELFSSDVSYKKALRRYLDNPTFEQSHKFQSDLRKLASDKRANIKAKQQAGKGVSSALSEEAKTADDLRKRVRGSMQQFLTNKEQPELLNKYLSTTEQYRKEFSPYLAPEIAKFAQGKSRPSKLINDLLRNEKFTKPKGAYKEIPGLATRRNIKESGLEDVLKYLPAGIGLGAGASLLRMLGLSTPARQIDKVNPY